MENKSLLPLCLSDQCHSKSGLCMWAERAVLDSSSAYSSTFQSSVIAGFEIVLLDYFNARVINAGLTTCLET